MKSILKKVVKKITHSLSSAEYWESRYQAGGNSGGGSYNALATYKANFINSFLTSRSIQSAIEFGCGDGNQLSLINYKTYIGLDVSPSSIQLCLQKFGTDKTKGFFLYHPFAFQDNTHIFGSQLSLSLDVIYHLIEDKIYERHMEHLFQSSMKYVIIYSSDYEHVQVNHERRREFTRWVAKHAPNWKLILKEESPYKNETNEELQSLSNFYVFEKT